MTTVRDEFLSEEDLDLRNLTDEELVAYWNQWLEQAQATNAADAHTYSHGVFAYAPLARHLPRVAEERSTYGEPKH
ncbi:MAG: hypothetical protein O2923_05465 [Verrucomicrobia bacterium]|nr:hypothetical protein [Verrucomicrobiota bacterium]MDA1088489.1 hypothetical protein [Verrucomicrobiota bacterium]